MPQAFLTCLENSSPILTKSSTRFIFILLGVVLFICNCTEGQHRFLLAPGTLAIPTFRKNNVFVCLRPREGGDLVSRASRFSRVSLAKIWLRRWKSVHSQESVSKQSSMGFQASQHRMSVPSCRFRQTRKAVEAIKSFVHDAVKCLPGELTFRHFFGFV